MYCSSVRDMWRTTDSKRMGWESQAEVNLLIRSQQENESPAAGGKPRQSKRKQMISLFLSASFINMQVPDHLPAPIPPVEIESADTPFIVAKDGSKRQLRTGRNKDIL